MAGRGGLDVMLHTPIPRAGETETPSTLVWAGRLANNAIVPGVETMPRGVVSDVADGLDKATPCVPGGQPFLSRTHQAHKGKTMGFVGPSTCPRVGGSYLQTSVAPSRPNGVFGGRLKIFLK